jgi:hypothetical protein
MWLFIRRSEDAVATRTKSHTQSVSRAHPLHPQDVFLVHSTYAEPPMRFEAGTPAIAEAIGMGAALDFLSGLGMERVGVGSSHFPPPLLLRVHHTAVGGGGAAFYFSVHEVIGCVP